MIDDGTMNQSYGHMSEDSEKFISDCCTLMEEDDDMRVKAGHFWASISNLQYVTINHEKDESELKFPIPININEPLKPTMVKIQNKNSEDSFFIIPHIKNKPRNGKFHIPVINIKKAKVIYDYKNSSREVILNEEALTEQEILLQNALYKSIEKKISENSSDVEAKALDTMVSVDGKWDRENCELSVDFAIAIKKAYKQKKCDVSKNSDFFKMIFLMRFITSKNIGAQSIEIIDSIEREIKKTKEDKRQALNIAHHKSNMNQDKDTENSKNESDNAQKDTSYINALYEEINDSINDLKTQEDYNEERLNKLEEEAKLLKSLKKQKITSTLNSNFLPFAKNSSSNEFEEKINKVQNIREIINHAEKKLELINECFKIRIKKEKIYTKAETLKQYLENSKNHIDEKSKKEYKKFCQKNTQDNILKKIIQDNKSTQKEISRTQEEIIKLRSNLEEMLSIEISEKETRPVLDSQNHNSRFLETQGHEEEELLEEIKKNIELAIEVSSKYTDLSNSTKGFPNNLSTYNSQNVHPENNPVSGECIVAAESVAAESAEKDVYNLSNSLPTNSSTDNVSTITTKTEETVGRDIQASTRSKNAETSTPEKKNSLRKSKNKYKLKKLPRKLSIIEEEETQDFEPQDTPNDTNTTTLIPTQISSNSLSINHSTDNVSTITTKTEETVGRDIQASTRSKNAETSTPKKKNSLRKSKKKYRLKKLPRKLYIFGEEETEDFEPQDTQNAANTGIFNPRQISSNSLSINHSTDNVSPIITKTEEVEESINLLLEETEKFEPPKITNATSTEIYNPELNKLDTDEMEFTNQINSSILEEEEEEEETEDFEPQDTQNAANTGIFNPRQISSNSLSINHSTDNVSPIITKTEEVEESINLLLEETEKFEPPKITNATSTEIYNPELNKLDTDEMEFTNQINSSILEEEEEEEKTEDFEPQDTQNAASTEIYNPELNKLDTDEMEFTNQINSSILEEEEEEETEDFEPQDKENDTSTTTLIPTQIHPPEQLHVLINPGSTIIGRAKKTERNTNSLVLEKTEDFEPQDTQNAANTTTLIPTQIHPPEQLHVLINPGSTIIGRAKKTERNTNSLVLEKTEDFEPPKKTNATSTTTLIPTQIHSPEQLHVLINEGSTIIGRAEKTEKNTNSLVLEKTEDFEPQNTENATNTTTLIPTQIHPHECTVIAGNSSICYKSDEEEHINENPISQNKQNKKNVFDLPLSSDNFHRIVFHANQYQHIRTPPVKTYSSNQTDIKREEHSEQKISQEHQNDVNIANQDQSDLNSTTDDSFGKNNKIQSHSSENEYFQLEQGPEVKAQPLLEEKKHLNHKLDIYSVLYPFITYILTVSCSLFVLCKFTFLVSIAFIILASLSISFILKFIVCYKQKYDKENIDHQRLTDTNAENNRDDARKESVEINDNPLLKDTNAENNHDDARKESVEINDNPLLKDTNAENNHDDARKESVEINDNPLLKDTNAENNHDDARKESVDQNEDLLTNEVVKTNLSSMKAIVVNNINGSTEKGI